MSHTHQVVIVGGGPVGLGLAIELGQRGIHTVTKILGRIDEGSIQIEDEQLQLLDGERPKYVNHASSLPEPALGDATA